METREEINQIILKILETYLQNNLDIRFWQGMYNLGFFEKIKNGVKDDYYLESKALLQRILKEIQALQRKSNIIRPKRFYVNDNNDVVFCTQLEVKTPEGYIIAEDTKYFWAKNIINKEIYIVDKKGNPVDFVNFELTPEDKLKKKIQLLED